MSGPSSAIVLFLAVCLPTLGQVTTSTTTLERETANNTSASSSFRGEDNGNAAPGNVSKLPISSLLYSGASTRVFARFMPWFGTAHHVDVGYRSDDPAQIRRQVDDMLSRGIAGAIVDWYGPDDTFKDNVTKRLMKEAERRGGSFSFAVSEDQGALKHCEDHPGCDVTALLVRDLKYAYDHFERSPAYLRMDGRPLLFSFGLEKFNIDWDRVRREIPGHPLLMFRNSGAFALPYSDGGFSWIAPETAKPGDPIALQYLERFYKRAGDRAEKLAMGSAYKGFDDGLAGWGKGRRIDQDCGATWLATLAETGRFYSSARQLPMLMVVTWNDYEEGTEIESGIDNCVTVQASASGQRLRWQIGGADNTLDRFTVFASNNGQELIRIADVPPSRRDFDMAGVHVPPGRSIFYIEAVGKASFLNHMSNAVRLQGPTAEH